MKKKLFFIPLIVLLVINIFSLIKVAPIISEEREQNGLIIITFKDKINSQIETKYGNEKYQKQFKETNKQLKKENKLFVVTKNKNIDNIKRNKDVTSVSRKIDDKIAPKEFKNALQLIEVSDGFVTSSAAVWFLFFRISLILIIINSLILIGLGIKRKIIKMHSQK